ncbi:MAG: 4-oxalocrotonate tautomerase [Desulfovibrio sp.]|nr:MAG: 4-oxalocrotonate tautomerase [Desulfovibrio sp.]
MPFVNVKLAKGQVDADKKQQIIEKLTNLIVEVMDRDRSLTTVVVDDIEPGSWAIGGKAIDPEQDGVSFVNIKVSKGTTNAGEMADMLHRTKAMMQEVLGNHATANYCIIDELNPSGWGFDGISMTERAKLEG